ncbi:MAG TPA: inorganic phosphate transporter [Gemmataceae bacterium]|jgi:PiT family inorganic phosphate transporter
MTTGTLLFLAVALVIALGFEAINGFHDTANAVATVIYTKSLKPQVAVVWSGLMNFLGVLLGGIAVAFGIVHLLPVDILVLIDTGVGMAMVIALLLAAMIWNFGTWYLGIPASSSHSLIGAILGVGLAHSWLVGRFGSGLNWNKVGEVGLSLLISPLIGFALAVLVLILFKRFVRNPELHAPPPGDQPPPWPVRAILLLTCTGVSFAHGSNDGQKGVGLIMLILIGLVPASFAMNMSQSANEFHEVYLATQQLQDVLHSPEVRRGLAANRPVQPVMLAMVRVPREEAPRESVTDLPPAYGLDDGDVNSVDELLGALHSDLEGKSSPHDLSPEERWQVRIKALLVDHGLSTLQGRLMAVLSHDKAVILSHSRSTLRGAIEYAPMWVIAAVAVALGLGTMVGWKRIVVTVGEKIGKTHLTYSQGASAELVAMSTIGMADVLGIPVSTTHVLSSGVAGSMAANHSGLQMSTIRNIALAWILTLPAAMLLAGILFLLLRQLV